MVPRSSGPAIDGYLTRIFTILLSSIPADRQICSICLDPYISHPLNEHPARVNTLNPTSTCQHAFGRHCLTSHITSGAPWSTRCPICREEWFQPAPTITRRMEEEDLESDGEMWSEDTDWGAERDIGTQWALNPRARADDGAPLPVRITVANPMHLRVHDAPEAVSIPNGPEVDLQHMGERQDVHGQGFAPGQQAIGRTSALSCRGRLNRCVGFLERILHELDPEYDDLDHQNEVSGLLMADVEAALERLWMGFEENGQGASGADHHPA